MSEKHTTPDALDLDAIRRRAVAATPGPWVAGWRSLDREQVMLAPNLPSVEFSCDAQGRKNAKFVAHAREDVTALLAEVTGLRTRIAELEEALAALTSPARRAAAHTAILNLLAQHHPDAADTTTHGGTGEPRALADDAAAYTDAAINALIGGA